MKVLRTPKPRATHANYDPTPKQPLFVIVLKQSGQRRDGECYGSRGFERFLAVKNGRDYKTAYPAFLTEDRCTGSLNRRKFFCNKGLTLEGMFPAPTECNPSLFEFAAVEGRAVVASFDGGRMTSDAGALLGAADLVIGLTRRLARSPSGCPFRPPGIADDPPPRQRILRIFSVAQWQDAYEPCARQLIVIQTQDPIAGAPFIQPGDGALRVPVDSRRNSLVVRAERLGPFFRR